jgi:hypothetical protein
LIAVQKGVPIPEKKVTGRPGKYPFATMQAGDSFAIPAGKDPRKVVMSLTNTAAAWARRHASALRFQVRLLDEDGAQVVRVWAIAK